MKYTEWSRKIIALSAAAVVLAVGLYGMLQREEIVEPEAEKTKLSLWHYWDMPEGRKSLSQLVAQFNESHADVEIELKYVPDEDFKKTLALAIADNTMPDLAIVDSSDVRYYETMGTLIPVDDCMEEEKYLDAAMSCCRSEFSADGRCMGLPLGMNCLVFYYNVDILEAAQADPPRTLDEFVDVACRVSSDSVYGCAFPSLQSEESLFCFLPILWAKGGTLGNINSEGGQEAFDFIRQLSKAGAMCESSENMTLTDIVQEFARGNIAMAFAVSGKEEMIRNINPDLHFQTTQIPNGDTPVSVIGGEVLTVTSEVHKEEALEFVRFMAELEQIKSYVNVMGYLAPRQDLQEWQVQQDPEKKKQVEYLKMARPREFTPYWPAVSMAVADTINQVILQEDGPDTIQELENRIESIREEWDEET